MDPKRFQRILCMIGHENDIAIRHGIVHRTMYRRAEKRSNEGHIKILPENICLLVQNAAR